MSILFLLILTTSLCLSQSSIFDQPQQVDFHRLNIAWGNAKRQQSIASDLALLDSIDKFLHKYPQTIFKSALFSYELDVSAGTYINTKATHALVDSLLRYDSLSVTKLWLANLLISRGIDHTRGISLLTSAFPYLEDPFHINQAWLLQSQYEHSKGDIVSARKSLERAIQTDSSRSEAWYALLSLLESRENSAVSAEIRKTIQQLEGNQALGFGQKSSRSPYLFKTVLPFSLTDLEGRQFSLSTRRGSVTVINFFATWCGPCVAELPTLNQLSKDFPKVSFLFVNLNETPTEITTKIKSNSDFRFLRNQTILFADTALTQAFRISAIPRTLVIDKLGSVRFDYLGFVKGGELLLQENLKSLLSEK